MPVSLFSTPRSSPGKSVATEMVDECLTAGLDRGASDIHLQPRSDRWDVSLRIDGVLHSAGTFTRDSQSDPVVRLMALAGLPSYLGTVPQEASLRWQDSTGNSREMRLAVFPTIHGHRAAIRIMDPRESIRELDQLGFDEHTQRQLHEICDARDGWLLVAGPAGSGKTTTLYACLSQIAGGAVRRSVLTVEDPVESVIDSISQSQLQPQGGMTLASAMRAAVRQDAEVLLVSEIRDVETAEAVLSAALTGHLCFSSIHAGTIGATLRRLTQMHLPEFAIQSGLRGILCQRLLRRLCVVCKPDSTPAIDCEHCHGTGYRGRIPISQMLPFDSSPVGQSVFAAVVSGIAANEIDSIAADNGILTLRDQADRLVTAGITDRAEVFRVLGRNQS